MPVYNEKILIVDSDPETQLFLKQELTRLGYQVFLQLNSKNGMLCFTKERPDLIIVDVVLEKSDGYSLCQEIRKISSKPILLFTAAANISDSLMAFEVGANDYIVKPVFKKEFQVRIRTLLDNSFQRKTNFLQKPSKILKIQNLIIEIDKQLILKSDRKIELTSIEYSLLKLFIENSEKVLSRTTIMENVWGYKPQRSGDTRIVDVNVSRLRSKIEEKCTNPNLILTVRSLGYIFRTG